MEQKWRIVIAVALGLLAVLLSYVYWQRREARLAVKEMRALFAARDISQGMVIDYDMLVVKSTPVKFIQPGALSAKESAVGKTAAVTIMAGEQILATKLVAPGMSITLAGKTPHGKRAVTIGLETTSAVGGMIRPGDHIDILAIFKKPPVTITLFQDVLVLAIGKEMIPVQEVTKKGRKEAPRLGGESVTLALSARQVQILNVAIEEGKIRLSLRPRAETEKLLFPVDLSELPPAVDLDTLLQFFIQREQPKRPPVEVIRGLKKELSPIPR